tara:strand:+ start:240 stop:500 length:261 start_codon:yes stop_codon:yes gene_type:complete
MGMCVPTDDYKSMKQFIINIGEYLMEMMQLVKKAIKVYGFVKITDNDGLYVKLNKNDLIEQIQSLGLENRISKFEFSEDTKELWVN